MCVWGGRRRWRRGGEVVGDDRGVDGVGVADDPVEVVRVLADTLGAPVDFDPAVAITAIMGKGRAVIRSSYV